MSLDQKIRIFCRRKHVDQRGWLLKVIDGKEPFLPKFTGEIYSIMAKPGETRARHYHELTNEWFTVIQGQAKLVLEDVESREQKSILLDADKPETIYVPAKIAHSFTNGSLEPFVLIAYADQLYDPLDTKPYDLAD